MTAKPKRNNLEFVYESLRDLGEVPAKQVMAATGLSNSATTDNLRRLMKAGRVERREDFDAMAPGNGTVVLWKVRQPGDVPVNPADVAEGVDEIATHQGERPTVVPAAYKGDHRDAAVVELPDGPVLDRDSVIIVPSERPASVADVLADDDAIVIPADAVDAMADRAEAVTAEAAELADPLDQLTAQVYDPAEVERATGTMRHPEHALHLDKATVGALLAADPVPDDSGPVAAVIVHTGSGNALTVGPFNMPGEARDWWHKRFNRMAADPQIALVLRPLDVGRWPTADEVDAAVEEWERERAAEQTPAEPASDNPGDVLAYMQSVRPVSPAPVGDPEPPRRQRRTRATSGEQRDTSGFYKRGALSEQIAAWMREHADQTYSPTDVAKALGAQTGSVGYAMDKLTAAGTLRLAQAKPKRYQAATADVAQ